MCLQVGVTEEWLRGLPLHACMCNTEICSVFRNGRPVIDDVMAYFRQKLWAKKLAVFCSNYCRFWKKTYITLSFLKKNAILSPKIGQKSQKIVKNPIFGNFKQLSPHK
jgi:hypothetical protein